MARDNAYRRAEERIARAQSVGAKELSLVELHLTRLPKSLVSLTHLQRLSLAGNQLTKLLPEIGMFTQLTELNLNGNQLAVLPAEIGQLKMLTKLYLSDNHLTVLPPEISQLTQLRVLQLSTNRFTTIQSEVGELIQLMRLYLSANQLVALPPWLGKLAQLRALSFHGNKLTTLDPVIAELSNLRELYLGHNQLTALPREVAKLTSLRELNLWGNQLTTLPPEIGHLTQLTNLDLTRNQLTTLPPEIGQLTQLTRLNVANNQLESLPREIANLAELTRLDLAHNRLTTLLPEIGQLALLRDLRLAWNKLTAVPESLCHLKSLEKLSLVDNQLGLPNGILLQAPEQILRYYFESRDEKGQPLLELKLLLVGRGQAGKTTLVKNLAGEEPNASEPETHSIAIRELSLECKRGTVRTRAWDFGGQEILHSTHQLFLTERSLYLLVLEPRSGMAQRDAEYWLKLIETQGRSSPTIVVLNWSHNRSWRVDEVKLRRKFPFIVGFAPTDALFGDGVVSLHSLICQTVDEQMADVWLSFPKRWHEIKNAVAGMSGNFLTHSQYSALCDKLGEKDKVAQADLAGILHALGLALYFGNDPRLHDTRVLNPGWVTGGVYAVIRAPSVQESDGQLTVGDMPQVLHEAEQENVVKVADYPPDTHGFILELMRAFQLCYASQEEKGKPMRYLVPELLPEFEPEMPEPWEKAPVRLRYRYEVLPPGLLSRFIVRTYPLSDDAPHWRHGVVLQHAEAKALIREELDRSEVQVFVVGGDEEIRRILVTMVRRELESLHAEVKMHPVEELELSGPGEQWISVRSLGEFENSETPSQKLAVQPEGTAEVNVGRELDKLVPAETREIDRTPGSAPLPVRLFVSYAHDDERQLKRLDAILDVLEQQYGLTSWQDKRLIAGDEWDKEIRSRLEEMDIFLFVASQTSLVRPYIKNPEIRRAKERHAVGEVEIVTIKLEPCACDEDDFIGKLQRLAPKFKSIAETSLRSVAWEQVRKDLLPVIRRVRDQKEKKTRV